MTYRERARYRYAGYAAAIAICVTPLHNVEAGAIAPSLCAADEVTYFSCQIKRSKKVASLCGPSIIRGFDPGAELEYRYGRHLEVAARVEQDAQVDQIRGVAAGNCHSSARHACHTCRSNCIAGSTTGASTRSTTTSACGLVAPALSNSRAPRAARAHAPAALRAAPAWPASPTRRTAMRCTCARRSPADFAATADPPHRCAPAPATPPALRCAADSCRVRTAGWRSAGRARSRPIRSSRRPVRPRSSAGSPPGSRCSRSPPAAAIRAARPWRAGCACAASASSPSER
jgi:hypothetical protein